MKVTAVVYVSQDEINWTVFGYAGSFPTTLVTGWAFMKVVIVYTREPGDVEIIGFTPPTQDRPQSKP